MNVLIKTATALGFIPAIPLFALPAHSAPAYEAGPSSHRGFSQRKGAREPGILCSRSAETRDRWPEPESGRLLEIRLHRQWRRLTSQPARGGPTGRRGIPQFVDAIVALLN